MLLCIEERQLSTPVDLKSVQELERSQEKERTTF